MANNRPLALVDLDDTLFQTARKMPEGAMRYPASFDVNGEVSGYQTEVQKVKYTQKWQKHSYKTM